MPQDIFRVPLGIEIQTADLQSGVQILQGTGQPGSRQIEQDAPVGTVYYQTDAATNDQNIWWKYRDVNDNVTDWQVSVSQNYVDSFVQGVSWREPVVVKNDTTYASLATAEAAVNTGTVDGVPVVNGSRILYTDITGENANVFIVTGIPGGSPLATLTEDSNVTTDGDALLVLDGTWANTQWMYDADTEGSPSGGNPRWVQIGSAAGSAEIANLRSYVGGSIGDTSPDYISNDIVVDGDNLTVGVSKLDNAIGTLQFTGNFFITDFDSGNYPSSTYDITRALNDLDIELGRQADQIKVFTGSAPFTGSATILDDTLLTSVATNVKWMLQIKDSGGARQSLEIHALTDGTTAIFTTYALLKVGGNIGGQTGLDVTIGNSPQSWIVSLNPNAGAGNLTYTLKRISYSYLA